MFVVFPKDESLCIFSLDVTTLLLHTSTRGSLIAVSEAVRLGEACMRLILLDLRGVRVVEFTIVDGWIVLRVVHLLLLVGGHLAALLVPAQLVWVQHAEHLREALANAGNSLCWVPEGQLLPWHELNLLAVHVNEALFAGGARESTKRLLAEHGVFLVLLTSAHFRHNEVVQVLQLLVMHLQTLTGLVLASELLAHGLDNLVESALNVHADLLEAWLRVDLVLQLLDPPGEFVL